MIEQEADWTVRSDAQRYRRERGADDEVAVIVPAYYDPDGAEPKVETIRSDGELRLFCRRLNDDYVEFVHTTVEPFLPEGPADA